MRARLSAAAIPIWGFGLALAFQKGWLDAFPDWGVLALLVAPIAVFAYLFLTSSPVTGFLRRTNWIMSLVVFIAVGGCLGGASWLLLRTGFGSSKKAEAPVTPSPTPQPTADVAELINWQRGNPETPPYVDRLVSVKDGNLTLRFQMYNKSKYPAYDISVRVWDIDKLRKGPKTLEEAISEDLATANIPSLAPNVSAIIGTIEIPSTETSKRFGAQYTTRLGAFGESIRVEKVGEKWLFAIRAGSTDGKIKVERIDPGFPRNDKGEVDW